MINNLAEKFPQKLHAKTAELLTNSNQYLIIKPSALIFYVGAYFLVPFFKMADLPVSFQVNFIILNLETGIEAP